MSNRMWFEEEDLIELCEPCENCPNPAGCIRQCAIESYIFEEVGKTRGEDQ